MLEIRMAGSNGTCPEAIKRLVCTVCDFFGELASRRCEEHQRQLAPMVESKIEARVREFLLRRLVTSSSDLSAQDLGLRATVASGAICGAALEWSRSKEPAAEVLADSVFSLISCALQPGEGSVERKARRGAGCAFNRLAARMETGRRL
jgi:hypothetical protein